MNKIFRIVWNEAAQAWVAVSELTKKHKKRASVTAVAATLVAGMLSPFAQASTTDSDVAKNLQPSELGTDYYFRVTTANTGEPDDLDYYNGCKNGNVDSACPDTEMNIGVLDKDSVITEETKDKSDNSRLILEGNKGIRLTRKNDNYTAHKITFDAPVEVASGSGAVSIEQPVEGDNAGHTIIKSEIISGTPDKIGVESKDGVTKITWVGGAGGAKGADGKSAYDLWKAKDGNADKSEADFLASLKGDKGQNGTNGTNGKSAYDLWKAKDGNANKSEADFLASLKGENGTNGKSAYDLWKAKDGNADKSEADFLASLKGDAGRQVVAGKGITATVNTDDTLRIEAKTKPNGGISAQEEGLSIDTDGTTITLKSGKVSAATGTITAGETPSVATADANKLAKAGEVAEAIKAAKTKVVAGSGIKVTSSGNEYTVSADLPFTKNAKDKSISLNEEGVIHNVANGRVAKDSKDAVNGSQLHAVERRLSGNMDKLNHRIDKMGKRADAGTASAIATANLLQSYRPGLSAATAAIGEYRGQSAVAVGYSRLSDNGKYGVKLSLGANTQGNVGAGAGVAYFW